MKYFLFFSGIIFFAHSFAHSMEKEEYTPVEGYPCVATPSAKKSSFQHIAIISAQIYKLKATIPTLIFEDKEQALKDFFETLNHYAQLPTASQDFIKENGLFGLKLLWETNNIQLLKRIGSYSYLPFDSEAITAMVQSKIKLLQPHDESNKLYVRAQEFSDTLEAIIQKNKNSSA